MEFTLVEEDRETGEAVNEQDFDTPEEAIIFYKTLDTSKTIFSMIITFEDGSDIKMRMENED